MLDDILNRVPLRQAPYVGASLAVMDADTKRIHDAVGGKDQWTAIQKWAGENADIVAGAMAGLAAAQPAVQPVEVAPRVWMVQGASALGSPANRNFISNAGFVVTTDGVVVIDALGSPALAEALVAAIRQVTPQPIRHLIVTHYHADHIYGLQVFKAAGARIVAHQAAREYLNADTAALRLQASLSEGLTEPGTTLVAADQWLEQATELRVGGPGGVALRLQPVGPAHTPEDLAVFVPSEGVLFAGDLVFRGRIPFVGQANSRHWIASLDALLALPSLFGGREVLVEAARRLPDHPLVKAALADLDWLRATTREWLPQLAAAKAANDPAQYSAMLDWGLRLVVLLAVPCALGEAAAWPVQGLIRHFQPVMEDRIINAEIGRAHV